MHRLHTCLLQLNSCLTCLQMVQLEDLPDLALKEVLQNLSTDHRRRLSCTSRRFRRLIGESWTHIRIALEGSNLVDSANLQLKWLLARDVFRLEKLVSRRARHVCWAGPHFAAAGLMQEAAVCQPAWQGGQEARHLKQLHLQTRDGHRHMQPTSVPWLSSPFAGAATRCLVALQELGPAGSALMS